MQNRYDVRTGAIIPTEEYTPQVECCDFDTAWAEYEQEREDFDPVKKDCTFEEYYGQPPERDEYTDYKGVEPTWFQLYENVSEGTPVSPPFETELELATWLSENGDYWCQRRNAEGGRGEAKPTFTQALSLVKSGYAPSMMMFSNESGSKLLGPYEMQDLDDKKDEETS